MLNSVSGILDKVLMTYTPISDGHLQFWYMLFLVIYYSLYVVATLIINHKKVEQTSSAASVFNLRSALKNHWIWLLAVLFVIADRCLFIANADPDSKVTIMTLIK